MGYESSWLLSSIVEGMWRALLPTVWPTVEVGRCVRTVLGAGIAIVLGRAAWMEPADWPGLFTEASPRPPAAAAAVLARMSREVNDSLLPKLYFRPVFMCVYMRASCTFYSYCSLACCLNLHTHTSGLLFFFFALPLQNLISPISVVLLTARPT